MEIKAYLIRDVFRARPGKSKELAEIFMSLVSHLENEGFTNVRIMTDYAGPYWTVVVEAQIDSIARFDEHLRTFTSRIEVAEVLKGYRDLVESGYREIFKIH
jgi:hypothetical protein